MNISLKWLKQYLDFDLTAQEVGDALTSLGLEVGAVEEVETIRGGLKGIVSFCSCSHGAGRVMSRTKAVQSLSNILNRTIM